MSTVARVMGRAMALFSAGLLALSLPGCEIPSSGATSPTISWQGLNEGQTIYGIVKLSAKAVGGEVGEVSFYDNGTDQERLIGTAVRDSSAVYSVDWFTQETANGTHAIYAAAFSGETAFSWVSITLRVDNRSRAESIPTGAIKMTPENDKARPQLTPAFKSRWYEPVPLEGAINTAGAEDSPFIAPDGNTLYFWFNGDQSKDVHQQAKGPMTGIYWSRKVNDKWQEPQRLFLQYFDETGFDGAQTVRGDTLWFASIREGNYRDMDFWTAKLVDGKWIRWTNAGELLNKVYGIGELHVTADGNELYFDSTRGDGRGGKDIWVTRKADGQWQEPWNIEAVNTTEDEGWPFISEDGKELWFTRLTPGPAIFRSLNVNGKWEAPELVVTALAGEPTLDSDGNLYFAHHRWDDFLNRVTEADIYVSYRR